MGRSVIDASKIFLLGTVLALSSSCASRPPLEERHESIGIHADAIVVDGHNDIGTWILDFEFDLGMDGADPEKRRAELYWVFDWLLPEPSGDDLRTHTDLERLRLGGVDAQFFSIFPHPRYEDEPGGSNGRAHAMIDALDEGRLAGAGFDVFAPEPPPPDDPLLHHAKVLVSPHVAWGAEDAVQRLLDLSIANVEAFVRGEPVNVVT